MAALISAQSAAGEFKLVPHRAIYGMHLASAGGTGAPTSVRGVMSYEIADKCDGWSVETSVMMRTSHGGGPEVENLRTIRTWESKNGLDFRFRVVQKNGGHTEIDAKGVAVLKQIGGAGVAEYLTPKAENIQLPEGTLFPVRHMQALIEKSKTGGGFIGKIIFEGSSTDEPYRVSAVIGPAAKDSGAPPEIAKKLRRVPNWSAQLAYFPFRSRSTTPEFELGVVYRENGVVERLRHDYGDYVIEARLQQIEFLKPAGC